LRLLHVIDNLKLGGSLHLAQRTWKGLRERGHEVEIAVLVNSTKEQPDCSTGFQVHRLNYHGDYRRPFSLSLCAQKLSHVIRDTNPDLVHSWLWLSDVVAAKSAKKCGKPHLSHILDRRNWQLSSALKHRFRRFLTKRAFQLARTRFLAVSQSAADFASQTLSISPTAITTAYNSIEIEDYRSLSPIAIDAEKMHPIRLGIAARIEDEKGHKFAIQAMKLLKAKGQNAVLKITGEGSTKDDLLKLTHHERLEDCVKFVGWVPDVKSFLEEIDVFLVPSIDSEGLPTTILEAMASGRIVVATDVGGAAEVITSGLNGLIVKPKDPQAIADAIIQITANPRDSVEMARQAVSRIECGFTMKHMLDVVEATYNRAMKEHRP
jgi:glycosyltransferase involved in cell wall biosynthesis